MKNILAVIIVSFLALSFANGLSFASGGSSITANSALGAFLSSYSVPNAIIAGSSYTAANVANDSYDIVQINSTGNSYMLVNTTKSGAYVFVLGNATAKAVLSNYLLSLYYPNQTVVSNLGSYMGKFVNQSAPPLTDCLTETGLQNYYCSASTNRTTCFQNSCQKVPVCNKVLNNFGPDSPFATGIINFSIAYQSYNDSVKIYQSLASKINGSNIGSSLQTMSAEASQISSLSHRIPLNPIFPPPVNMTPQQISSTCGNYGANNGPWYCYSVGFCEYTNSNYTYLQDAQGEINYLLSTPVSSSSMASIAAKATANANFYYSPVFNKTATAEFNAKLGPAFLAYNSLSANMSFVLLHYSNASLSGALSNLTIVHNSIAAAGLNQNFTTSAKELGSAVSNALVVYNRAGAGFLKVYSAAFNSTALIAIQEFDYRQGSIPYYVASLAAKQAAINVKLQGMVNSSYLNSADAQILSISSQARGLSSPISVEAMTKSLYSGFASALAYSANTPASSQIASAPAYAPILPIVVGLIIVFLIYIFTYHRFAAKKRLRLTPSVKRAWMLLFIVLIIIVVIIGAMTYAYAQGANSSMPVSSFISGVSGANTIYLLENTSLASNSSVDQCAASVSSILSRENKTVYRLNFSGYACTSATGVSGAACFSKILASGLPTILLTTGNSTISFKGFYGDTLYASGTALQGSSCLLGNMLSVSR